MNSKFHERLFIFAASFLLAAVPGEAQAYIDPGTGGMLLQLMLGGFVGLLIILKLYWQRLKALFSRRKPVPTRPTTKPSDQDV